jgi:predicted DNA-binding protein
MACAKLGVSMKDFLLQLAFEKIEDMEDEWLSDKATETLNNIKSGKETLVSWEDAKKRLNE